MRKTPRTDIKQAPRDNKRAQVSDSALIIASHKVDQIRKKAKKDTRRDKDFTEWT